MTPWESFFERMIRTALVPGARVLDVGGGLRIDQSRGNIEDPSRAWIKPLIKDLRYEVLDPVDTYHPDIVGDVMNLPLEDASYDAILCLAVLEHVPRPWDAVREMHRVLKPGGHLLLYVPFLSPYHAMPGYYGDYVRFTDDGLRALCADFEQIELTPVRGPVETVGHLLPGTLGHIGRKCGRLIDRVRPGSGKQTAGHFLHARRSRERNILDVKEIAANDTAVMVHAGRMKGD